MRSFETWLDKFCRKHRNLAIPNLMFYIVMGNALVFLLDNFSLGSSFSSMISFVPSAIFQHFQMWRLVTFIFVPEGNGMLWTALALYFYYFVGKTLENEWGSARFTVYYGMGVLVNILAGLVLTLLYGVGYPFPVVTMYYVNMSLFFAFASLYPDMQVLLLFIPIKVKWLGWFNAALFAWDILQNLLALNILGVVLPLVAILNFLLFFSDDAMRMFGRVKYQHSRQTVNFKKATKEAKKEKGYLHKCAVCGITDTDHPEMEFRYCSKCNGYYCYCMNHINNHVHIE